MVAKGQVFKWKILSIINKQKDCKVIPQYENQLKSLLIENDHHLNR